MGHIWLGQQAVQARDHGIALLLLEQQARREERAAGHPRAAALLLILLLLLVRAPRLPQRLEVVRVVELLGLLLHTGSLRLGAGTRGELTQEMCCAARLDPHPTPMTLLTVDPLPESRSGHK
jgi:hypothetical protein